ncbi:hypothetical protein D9M69_474490 [compost metagenome]
MRAGAAGAGAAGRPHAGSASRGRQVRQRQPDRRRRRARCEGRAGRRARHPVRAVRRDRRTAGQAARTPVEQRRGRFDRDGRQGNRRGREVPRLLRLQRNHPHGAVAPRAGAVPRPQRGRADGQAGPGRRTGRAGAAPVRRHDRAPCRHPAAGPPGRQMAGRRMPLVLAREGAAAPGNRAADAAARNRRKRSHQGLRPQPA